MTMLPLDDVSVITVQVPDSSTVMTIQVPGVQGPPGVFKLGTVTTGAAGTNASATTTSDPGNPNIQVVNLTIPRGNVGAQGIQGIQGVQGPVGPANTLAVGTITTLAAGSQATATITGTYPNQTLNLSLPAGATGPTGPPGAPNTLTIGTVTTLTAGSPASATITGSAPNQILNLSLPQGTPGASGVAANGMPQGGAAGTLLSKNTAGDFDTLWITPASAATSNAIMQRDANGRAQVVNPSASADIATKSYVDSGDHGYLLNYQTATAYTLALSDAGTVVRMNAATAMTVTVPPNSSVAYPTGTWIEVERTGAGTLTLAPGSGVTIIAPDSDKTVRAINGRVRLLKTGTDTWYLSGDNNNSVAQAVTTLGGRNAANGYVGLDGSSNASVGGTLSVTGRITAPGKLSIFSNSDVSLTTANDTAPLQIGINGDVQTLWDNNEMYSRTWNTTTGAYDLNTFGMSASAVVINANATGVADLRLSGGQATRTDNAVRKDYVDGKFGAKTTMSYQNGWSTVSGFAPLAATMVGNIVFLTGVVKNSATITPQSTICTLPSGMRPTTTHTFPAIAGDVLARIDLASDGLVRLVMIASGTLASGAYLAINISFDITG